MNHSVKRKRAIALLSGGLDSTVAIKLMLGQGIDVLAVNFTSPFCTCGGRKLEGCNLASSVAASLGVPIRVVHKGMEYLRIVERPRFGHGRGVNPCIDCRIFMLRKVAEIMNEESASFVVTGEVLGQRPMSQRARAMTLIERESGLEGILLRPLSAKYLPPTKPEMEGVVDRSKLLNIRGRSRKTQIEFAKNEGLNVFGCPAGGCLLTDSAVAARMRDLFSKKSDWGLHDAKLATIGRHFRLNDKLKVILGRDEGENARLKQMAGSYAVVEFVEMPGPLAVICGEFGDDDIRFICGLMRYYTKHSTGSLSEMRLSLGDKISQFTTSVIGDKEEISKKRIA